MINLKYGVEDRDYGRISGKYPDVKYEQPSQEIEALGIDFKLWKSSMMAGVILLFDCTGVPDDLPGYIEVVDSDLSSFHNKWNHGIKLTTNEVNAVKHGEV